MLNPEHLQTFVAVAETGSFSAAASRLGFTQPAVSRHIKALEAHIGDVRLFRRVGKAMRLTHAGEELLLHAREVVDLLAHTEQHMHGLRGQLTGRIGIGSAPNGGERMLPQLLAAFHAKHPGVQFAFDIGMPDDLLAWLDSGQLQAIVTDEQPRRRTYDVLELASEAIIALSAHDHPLHTQESVALLEVSQQPLVVPPRGVALRRSLEDVLRRHGGELTPTQIVLETDSLLVTLEAVAAGLGIAFVPQRYATQVPDVAVLLVPELVLEQAWYLVRQRGSAANRAVDALWSFVVEMSKHPNDETAEG
jgi:DNA-binding transcriptional LysR family regulator